MALVCESCGKGVVHGRSQQHRRGVAGKRWRKRAQSTKRVFKPNLQKVHGQFLCTDCIKKKKRQGTLAKTAAK